MKIKFALFSTILFSTLSLPNPGFALSVPTCVSNDSDSDGDGYGWENNDTCLVDANTGTNMTGQCEDRGGFPWGWNSTTLTSCRLDEQPGECVDDDGDGFGWDGVTSCRIDDVPSGDYETYLGQMMGKSWSCYDSNRFDLTNVQQNSLDRIFSGSFIADGVTAITFYGGRDNSIPIGPETNPGTWTRGYPAEDWELHVNGRYNTSRGNFLDRIPSEWGQSRETLFHWQIILQIIEPINPDHFSATFYLRDSVAEYQRQVDCLGRAYDSHQGLNDDLFER